MTTITKNSVLSKQITDSLFKDTKPENISDIFSLGDSGSKPEYLTNSPQKISSLPSSSSSSSTSSGLSTSNWIILTLVIILFLSFVGLNIFTYLSKGTNSFTDFFKPIFDYFTNTLASLGLNVVNTTAEGVNVVTNVSGGVVKGAALGGVKGYKLSEDENNNNNSSDENNELNNLLSSSSSSSSSKNKSFVPDDSFSSIQTSGTSGKAGFCYYGSDNGIRYCAEVGADDKCISGEIFPTRDICINPSLRL